MANCVSIGLDDLTRGMTEYADLWKDDDFLNELCHTGADEIINCIADEIQKSRFSILHMSNKLTYAKGKLKRNKNGEPYTTVTVKGKNAYGTRNAAILFVLNYGRNKKYGEIVGEYFWTKGSKKADENLPKILDDFIQTKIDERGL